MELRPHRGGGDSLSFTEDWHGRGGKCTVFSAEPKAYKVGPSKTKVTMLHGDQETVKKLLVKERL